MTLYRFCSRRSGYRNGNPVRYYETDNIYDSGNVTKCLVDKSGKEILILIHNLKIDDELKQKVLSIAKTYPTWYYYSQNDEITDKRTYM